MNEPISPDLLESMDRLVDGELSESERDALLRSCDDSPALWRNLALAYIEAQSWREDMGVLAQVWATDSATNRGDVVAMDARSVSPDGNAVASSSSDGSVVWPWKRNMNYMGMAAAVLISIGLGFGFGSLVNSLGAGSGDSVAGNLLTKSNGANRVEDASVDDLAPRSGVPQSPDGRSRSVPFFVQIEGQNGYRRVDVPLLERDALEAAETGSDSIPRLLRGLERHGRVTQESQYYPVQLDDGRRAVVPIDNFRIEFDAYQ